MTPLLTALATDVDDIKIVFNESSLTTLKIVIGLILFGIALDTDVEDFRRAADVRARSPSASGRSSCCCRPSRSC